MNDADMNDADMNDAHMRVDEPLRSAQATHVRLARC